MGLFSFLRGSVEAAVTIVRGPDPTEATDPAAASYAALARLSRMNNGEAVAVSLAGGGAWGFGHIGLLEHLVSQNVPTDFVAGVSSGSIVAALHAWKTTDQGTGATGLEELRARHREALPVALCCMASMRFLERWITAVTGGTLDLQTESECLTFHTRVLTGAAESTSGEELGVGVAAASSMPPLFAPKNLRGDPVIDGGFSYNLPPLSLMWAASGRMPFFVASNPIPKEVSGVAGTLGTSRLTRAGLLRRVRDVGYGVFHLLRTSSALAAEGAELTFEPDLRCWNPVNFDEMVAIADRGYMEAKARLSGPKDPSWSYATWVVANSSASATYLYVPTNPPPAIAVTTPPCP